MKFNLIWHRLLTAALDTLENWQQCLTFLPEKQLLHIPINPSVSVGKFTRWSPLNPLTLVSTKPDELS
jgi:precorrin-6Y C5,15-methyltransferase (decarboxylating)